MDSYIDSRMSKERPSISPVGSAKQRKRYPHNPCLPPCQVCGAKATGSHFGQVTCEACKNFFRRSFDRSTAYKCKQENKCEVTAARRISCSSCRLQKCLDLGMSLNSAIKGRYTSEQKNKFIMQAKQGEKPAEKSTCHDYLRKPADKSNSYDYLKENGYPFATIQKHLSQTSRKNSVNSAEKNSECHSKHPVDLVPKDGSTVSPCSDAEYADEGIYSSESMGSESMDAFTNSQLNSITPPSTQVAHSEVSTAPLNSQSTHTSHAFNGHSLMHTLPDDPFNVHPLMHTLPDDPFNAHPLRDDDSPLSDLNIPPRMGLCTIKEVDLGESLTSGQYKKLTTIWTSKYQAEILTKQDDARVDTLLGETVNNSESTPEREELLFRTRIIRKLLNTNIISQLMEKAGCQELLLDPPRPEVARFWEEDLVDDDLTNAVTDYVASVNKAYQMFREDREVGTQHREHKEQEYKHEKLMENHLYGGLNVLPYEVYKDIYTKTGLDVDGRAELLKKCLKYADMEIIFYMEFAKSIPGYQELCDDDKCLLLANSWCDWLFFSNAYFTSWEDGYFCHCPSCGMIVDEKDIKKLWWRSSEEQVHSYFKGAEAVFKLNLSLIEEGLLKAILLFSTDRVGSVLRQRDVVQSLHDHYVTLLVRHLQRTHRDWVTFYGRIIRVLILMTEQTEWLFNMTDVFMNDYKDLECQLSPLHAEFIYLIYNSCLRFATFKQPIG